MSPALRFILMRDDFAYLVVRSLPSTCHHITYSCFTCIISRICTPICLIIKNLKIPNKNMGFLYCYKTGKKPPKAYTMDLGFIFVPQISFNRS